MTGEEIVKAVYQTLSFVDKEVFPENPYKIVTVTDEAPTVSNWCLVRTGDPTIDFYMLFRIGAEEAMSAHLENLHLITDKLTTAQEKVRGGRKYTVEEVLYSIAAHEVRHRQQSCWPNLQRFTPSVARKIECLKFITKQIEPFLPGAMQSGSSDADEFDSLIIEHLVAHEFLRGRATPESIIRTVRMTPDGLRQSDLYYGR